MQVQEILHFRGKTQSQVAEALGHSMSYVSELCRGIKVFPLDKIEALAALIDADPAAVALAFIKVRKVYEQRGRPDAG